MPDNDNLLPTRRELTWKSMFSPNEHELEAASQLLAFGLFREDDAHAYMEDIRLDPNGHYGDDSPGGRIIKNIVDGQLPEDQLEHFEEPVPPPPPACGVTPEPGPTASVRPEDEVGTLAWKMAHPGEQEPEMPRHIRAQASWEPGANPQPPHLDFDLNRPL
jgi:hypothetical protein